MGHVILNALLFGALHSLCLCCSRYWDSSAPGLQEWALCPAMEETVHLADSSQCTSARMPIDVDCNFEGEFAAGHSPVAFTPATSGGGVHGGVRTGSARPLCSPSQLQSALPHKVRGPNWTEAEMLVLIAQKRVDWDGQHNCNQPSLAKFVYGTTAWKLVLAGCMSVVGFRPRDMDQITNKWDGLIKDYKKLKEYIDGTGLANW